MEMSYCDNCIHERVCKHVKYVKEYEEKCNGVVTADGLRFTCKPECVHKLTRIPNEESQVQ